MRLDALSMLSRKIETDNLQPDNFSERLGLQDDDSRYGLIALDGTAYAGDSVYRIAIEDFTLEKKDSDKAYKTKDTIVCSSKEMNKRFGSKHTYEDYDKEQTIIFKAKQEVYNDILKYIDSHQDLTDVYIYVKENAKKTKYDEIKII